MRQYFVLALVCILGLMLVGCEKTQTKSKTMSSYNSQKIQNMKNQYKDNKNSEADFENKKYEYSDNVLKIDLK